MLNGGNVQFLFVFHLLAESPPHHYTRCGESEGECHPHAYKSVAEHEAAQIAYGQRYDEEGYEGDDHKRLNVGNAAQGVGVVYLQAVAKLIDEERQHECEYSRRYFSRIGKPSAHVIAQQEYYSGKEQLQCHHYMQSCQNSVARVGVVVLSVEIACAHGNGSSKTVVHHKGEL